MHIMIIKKRIKSISKQMTAVLIVLFAILISMNLNAKDNINSDNV